MKKTLFRQFLQSELKSKTALLSANSLSDEDKALVQAAVDELQSTIDAVDALEEENSEEAINALKETVENLAQGLKAVQEKIQNQEQTETEPMTEDYLKSQTANLMTLLSES